MSFRRSRRSGSLRAFLLGRKLVDFDSAVALPRDVDGERSMLEAVTDGIGDDGICDELGSVIGRQLLGEHRWVCRSNAPRGARRGPAPRWP